MATSKKLQRSKAATRKSRGLVMVSLPLDVEAKLSQHIDGTGDSKSAFARRAIIKELNAA